MGGHRYQPDFSQRGRNRDTGGDAKPESLPGHFAKPESFSGRFAQPVSGSKFFTVAESIAKPTAKLLSNRYGQGGNRGRWRRLRSILVDHRSSHAGDLDERGQRSGPRP